MGNNPAPHHCTTKFAVWAFHICCGYSLKYSDLSSQIKNIDKKAMKITSNGEVGKEEKAM